jgi:tetratricopeptide (TPR) repeat protein
MEAVAMSATTGLHQAAAPEQAFQRGIEALRRGALEAADAAFADCLRQAPLHPPARLGRAMVLSARGRTGEARDAVRALLADAPGFGPAQRALADALREAEPAEAGQWFTRCARRDPADVGAIGGALLLAARLQREGRTAPDATSPPLAAAPQRISVVMCSIRPAMLARARDSLARAFGGAPWELVHVDDARSLCEGWNRGLARARGDIVVFCHDDIALACDRLGERLAGALARDDVVGAAGSTRLAGPNWVWAGAVHARGWMTHMREGELLAGAYALEGPEAGGIETLDGVFIAARRDAAQAIGFDAEAFDGWHLYDADFCWRARRAGLRLAVRCDLGLVHWSEGGFDAAWAHYARRFLQRAGLPESPMPQAPGAAVPVATIDALPGMHAWLAYWIANA